MQVIANEMHRKSDLETEFEANSITDIEPKLATPACMQV